MQVTWRDGERWIGMSDRSTRVDQMDPWSTGDLIARDASRPSDQDPTGEIEGVL